MPDMPEDNPGFSQEEKADAIKKEVMRLRRICSKVDRKRKAAVEGLIQRAAFMRVSLTQLEEDLLENGFTELFSQGDQDPYERRRPTADFYNSMNTSYQKIVKQITDLLPKEDPKPGKGDGFDSFVNGREDD